MSVVNERREMETATGERSSVASQVSLGLDRRVLVAHSGDRVGFSIRINGPPEHVMGVEVRGIPPSVAKALVSPSRGVPPYTARVLLVVSKGTEPGMHPFYVVIHAHSGGQSVGKEKLGLLVLPRKLTLRHYVELRRIYRYEGLGAQGVLWYLIAEVYKNSVGFMELKRAYEQGLRACPKRPG